MNVTSNLSEFGRRELLMAAELMEQLANRRTTALFDAHFTHENTTLFFNKRSGCVWLGDENYNVGMINPTLTSFASLDLYITTNYTGTEGFLNELMEEFNDLHPEDQKQILDLTNTLELWPTHS
jgi:hypothetical protein